MFVAAIILFIPVVVVLIYVFKIVKHFVLSYFELCKLPGPPRNSVIIGSILHLHTTPEKIFNKLREWKRIYYPIYNVSALYVISANVLSPEDCELILSNPKHNEKSRLYELLHNWLRTGLLTSKGQKWLTRRRILTPAFHFSILQQFINVFNDQTDQLVETFKKQCHQPFITVDAHIAQFTLKTITETAMGVKLTFDTKEEIGYKQAVFDIGQIYLYRLLHSWFIHPILNLFSPTFFKERKTLKVLHRFTEDIIDKRQKTYQKVSLPTEKDDVYKSKTRLAMLDLLLTMKNKEGVIDIEGIREEVDTFVFEGHDTTAAAIGFSLMLIASHKHVQDQIVQEMVEVLGDLRKKPTYNDLQEMKYMERTIKEVLRLYPSVHFISRKLGEDVLTNSGYVLPKHTIVHLHFYDVHHNADIYPDPEKFDPDRFLPENSQNRHPFAYLPFSAGPRNCIGQRFAMLELKAVLCGVLANFILEAVDTPSTIVVIVDLILRTKNGIRVKFIPRANNKIQD